RAVIAYTPAWSRLGVHEKTPVCGFSVAPAGRSVPVQVSGSPSASVAASATVSVAPSATARSATPATDAAAFVARTTSGTDWLADRGWAGSPWPPSVTVTVTV